jgi:hypothetical protein
MSALINWAPDLSFWKANPSYLAVKEFKKFYDEDKDKQKKPSSDLMWALCFFADATQHNIYRNISEEERLDIIYDNTGTKFNPAEVESEIKLYRRLTLNQFERSMVSFMSKLEEREGFINATPYTISNAKVLDDILSNTKTLYELYQKLQEDIEKHKDQSGGTTRGNVQESASEQGIM